MLLAIMWAGPFRATPSAAVDGASISISKACSPKAPVGGLVKYDFTLVNNGTVGLDRDSVIDSPNLGDLTAAFPAHLDPGQVASVTRFYAVQESDARPLVNTVVATYHAADGTVATHSATCSVNVPHLSITKELTVNNTSSTFRFTITNDGNGNLTRFSVTDSELGDITSHFPLFLAQGQTVVVEITVTGPRICNNTVTAVYQNEGTSVSARATCRELPQPPSFTIAKRCSPTTGQVGTAINVVVEVTNTGPVPLIIDPNPPLDSHTTLAFSSGDTNGNGKLDPGETWTYTGSYNPGTPGTYTNTVTVTARTEDSSFQETQQAQSTCSRQQPPGNEGCTPGFWKNHLSDWAATGYSTSDDFDATFGVNLFNPNITLGTAIGLKGGGVNVLARHGTAALLSAAHPNVNYPYTVAQVIAFVQAGNAAPLVTANELGCDVTR